VLITLDVLALSMGAYAQLPTEAISPNLQPVPPLWGNLQAGSHAVGFRTIFRYDSSRTWKSTRRYDGTFSPDLKGRPIQINVWYPASPDQSSTKMQFGDYVDQSAPEAFAELNTIMRQRSRDDAVAAVPRNEIPELQSAEVNAYRDAPWAKGAFPMVLYFGGLNAPINSNALLGEYLPVTGTSSPASRYSDPLTSKPFSRELPMIWNRRSGTWSLRGPFCKLSQTSTEPNLR